MKIPGTNIPEIAYVPPITPDQVRKARLFVCEKATDVEDARELLEALGLS